MSVCIAATSQNDDGEDKYTKISLRFMRDVGASYDRDRAIQVIKNIVDEENPNLRKFLAMSDSTYDLNGSDRYEDPLFSDFSLFINLVYAKFEKESMHRNLWSASTLPKNISYKDSGEEMKSRLVLSCSLEKRGRVIHILNFLDQKSNVGGN